jgi:hypothetical protein
MENTPPLWSAAKPAQHGNYAGLPGTGPHGTACADCALVEIVKNKPTCGKFKRMTGRQGTEIYRSTASCRYFERRQSVFSVK